METNAQPATGTESATQSTTGATPADADVGLGGGNFLIYLVVIWGAVLYFFFMRPQKKKDAARKDMLGTLKKGDKVITIGGIHGTVTNVKDDTVTLKVDDKTGATLKFQRAAINDIPTAKGEDA
ncbi:MAG: preprotein translocase subunit YajC [Planctomycetota bacterium]|jgi:preprotein translocase subunit YajC